MGQVSAFLRNVEGGYAHWCPGCEEMHTIWVPRWSFNGDVNRPTFGPSVLITYNGPDAGQDRGDGFGKAPPAVCHYYLVDGELRFRPDSTHAFAGKAVPLPKLPAHGVD